MLRLVGESDDKRTLVAFEYRRCPALRAEAFKRGCKLLLKDCLLMNGLLAMTPESVRWIGGGWPAEHDAPPPSADQDPAPPPPHASFDDVVDLEDLETIAALERAALQSKVQKKASPPPPPPVKVPAVASSAPKKPRKRFLDDSE